MRTRLPSIDTPASTPSASRLAGLAFFWFGIQAIWGALLGISVQARVAQVAGTHALFLYGYVATSGAFVAACTQLVAGPFSDRRRRRTGSRRVEFYVTGAVLASAALFWFYRAPTPALLVASYAFLQVALNIAIGPYQAAIPDAVASSSSGRASGWMAAFQSAGNAAGAVCATFVGSGIALAGTLGALLLATCAITSRAVVRWPRDETPSAAPLRFTRPFALLFLSRVALFAGFYTLLGYMFFYTVAFLAPQAAAARRIDGILILCFTIVGACGAALAAKPADRFDRRNVASLGAFAAVAGLAIFVTVRSPVGAAIAILLGGTGWGVFLVADWAIACRLIPRQAAAGSMAIWNLAVLLPQLLAPLAATALIARLSGTLRAGVLAAFVLAGIEMLVGILLLRRLPVALTRE